MNGKRLTRSSSNAMLAGVCGGLGAYFGVDATAMRVGTIVVAILTGIFPLIIAYILCAIVMPADTAAPGTPPDAPDGPGAA